MTQLLTRISKANPGKMPGWLADNTIYLTQFGSVAYGVAGQNSDQDFYGICIPPKDLVFPHTSGLVLGFDDFKPFEQWQQHHLKLFDEEDTYDFSIYSITKFFRLAAECNPNIIDSLFVPRRCILKSTQSMELIRENRTAFLSKQCYHKFKGYAYSQLTKIRSKQTSENPNRQESIDSFGYDVKFAYHLVRLLSECQQILVEGDLDIEANREQLKSIRRGEWPLEKVESWFDEMDRSLQGLYASSKLREAPNRGYLRGLLLSVLESHYGSLESISVVDKDTALLRELKDLVEKFS